ncbi:hypothetical protein ACFIOY_34170 [Bradyrhizobium sp. TZ2]
MNGGDGWVNDKAVPLLGGAPPQVRERDHDDSHADDIALTSGESKPVRLDGGWPPKEPAVPGAEKKRGPLLIE